MRPSLQRLPAIFVLLCAGCASDPAQPGAPPPSEAGDDRVSTGADHRSDEPADDATDAAADTNFDKTDAFDDTVPHVDVTPADATDADAKPADANDADGARTDGDATQTDVVDADVTSDDATDVLKDVLPDACGGQQRVAYQAGCTNPQTYCADIFTDACASFFCGCDGVTFFSGCGTSFSPFAYAGRCADAGDASID